MKSLINFFKRMVLLLLCYAPSFSITAQSDPTLCGFDRTYAQGVDNPTAQNLGDGGFSLSSNDFTLTLDAAGTQTGYVKQQPVTGARWRTKDSYASYVAAAFTADTTIELKKTDASGAIVYLTKNIDFTHPQTSFYQSPSVQKVVPTPDGYVIAVYYSFQAMPNTAPSGVYGIVKTDLGGNKISQKLLAPMNEYPRYFWDFFVGQSGNAYLITRGFSNIAMHKISNTASGDWTATILDDLPSSELTDVHESADGNILVCWYSNGFGAVGKLDSATGDRMWMFTSFNLLPITGPIWSRPYGSWPTPDGGAVFSMSFHMEGTASSTVIGRLSAGGELIWHKLLGTEYTHRPVLATSDGGFLFAGNKTDVGYGVLKTASNGELACLSDLKITLSADKSAVPLWDYVTLTATVKNEGIDPVLNAVVKIGGCSENGVEADFDQSYKLVYAGLPGAPTAGSFNFVTQEWKLSKLAAGAQGVLTIPLFTIGAGEKKMIAFAKSQTPGDADSRPSPNPPANCTPEEDDEALCVIQVGQNLTQGFIREQAPASVETMDYHIIPNPARDVLQVYFGRKTSASGVSLTLFNQLGQVVFSKKTNQPDAVETLDLSGIANGQYFLKIHTEGQRDVVKKVSVARE